MLGNVWGGRGTDGQWSVACVETTAHVEGRKTVKIEFDGVIFD